MIITDALIDKLANLSRLEITANERNSIIAELEKMLDFVNKIQELETGGVEPLIHITQENNRFRNDIPYGELSHEAVLLNAPKKDSDYIRVPKVVEK